MKNIFKIGTVLMFASAVLSCEKDPVDTGKEPVKPEPKPEVEVEIDYTEGIDFSLELLSVEATAAEVKVTHIRHHRMLLQRQYRCSQSRDQVLPILQSCLCR